MDAEHGSLSQVVEELRAGEAPAQVVGERTVEHALASRTAVDLVPLLDRVDLLKRGTIDGEAHCKNKRS
jgi:hypothetical protein